MRATIAVVSALTIGFFAIFLSARDSSSPPDACGPVDVRPSADGVAAAGQATVCLLNRERAKHDLPPLRENGLLSAASLEHSRDMVQRRYFEHTAPDGRDVRDRLRAVGYSQGVSASTGENIAYGFATSSTPSAIVRLWMKSPGHRADILRPAFREIGVGVAIGAPQLPVEKQSDSATYTTDFGGVVDPSLQNG